MVKKHRDNRKKTEKNIWAKVKKSSHIRLEKPFYVSEPKSYDLKGYKVSVVLNKFQDFPRVT